MYYLAPLGNVRSWFISTLVNLSIVIIFSSKCNPEMVELMALDQEDDMEYVKRLLTEFREKTESLIADELLKTWPEAAKRFVKVILTAICVHSS